MFSLIIVRVGLGLTSDLTYTSRDVMSTIAMSDRHQERTARSAYSRRAAHTPRKPSAVLLSRMSNMYSTDHSTRISEEDHVHSAPKVTPTDYKLDIPYLSQREDARGKSDEAVRFSRFLMLG